MIPISLDPSFSLRRAPPSQNTAHPSPLRLSSLPRHLSFTLTVSLTSASSPSLSRSRTHTHSFSRHHMKFPNLPL
ncbi:hypothetical protein AAC387_Pa06g1339 [Persea americana]